MKQMTQQMRLHPMGLLAAVCSMAMVVGFVPAGLAQQAAQQEATKQQPAAAPAHTAVKPVAEEEEEAPSAHKPSGSGVKVHGHWVLQAKNADGTLGERREFENSLITSYSTNTVTSLQDSSSGSQLIVAMLSGNLTVGDPGIGLVQGALGGDPSTWCLPSGRAPTNIGCYVFTSANSFWNLGPLGETSGLIGSSLGLTYSATFTPTASIILSGNYTVPTGLTSISAVQSLYSFCIAKSAIPGTYTNVNAALQNSASFRNADMGSSSCTIGNIGTGTTTDTGLFGALTSTAVTSGTPAVPAPLSVTPGQIVQVSVVLTFS